MAKFCTNCGATLDDDKKFCTACGIVLPETAAPAEAAAPNAPASQPAPPRPQPQPPTIATAGAVPPKGSKYDPITTWGYIGICLLMCIPLIGLVLTIFWACGKCKKIAKRNFARATLIMLALSLVISLVLAIVGRSLFKSVMDSLDTGSNIDSSQFDEGNSSASGSSDLSGLLSGLGALSGSDVTNSDIEDLEALGDLLGGLGALMGSDGSGLEGLLDGAIAANKDAEKNNSGWPDSLRKYPGGTATAVASYRTEISGTSLDEMMGWIADLKKDGFTYQDFYSFGMSEEDMLNMNAWWAYDGKTYLSVSYADGTVTVDHTKELPDLASYFG